MLTIFYFYSLKRMKEKCRNKKGLVFRRCSATPSGQTMAILR